MTTIETKVIALSINNDGKSSLSLLFNENNIKNDNYI